MVVLSAVLLVSLVIVNALLTASQPGASLKEQQSSAYWRTATPFSILSYALDSGTLVAGVRNQLNKPIKLTAVQVNDNGTPMTIWSGSRVFWAGEEAQLYMQYGADNDCRGANAGALFEIAKITFLYDRSDDLQEFSQIGVQPLVGRCKERNGIVFVPPTPSDGAAASVALGGANVTLNATMGNDRITASLGRFGLVWNGTATSFYNSSLVLCYNFDNVSTLGENATRAVDVSMHGNNCTISEAFWTTDARYGKALSFNGASAYLTVPDSQSTNLSGSVSVAAWVKPGDNRQNTVLSKGAYSLAIGPDDVPYFEVGGGEAFSSLGTPEEVYASGFATANGSVYATGYENGTVMRYDGGTTWTSIGYPAGAAYAIVSFNRTIFVADYNGTVYRYDGGTSWTSLGNAGGTVYGLTGFGNTLYAGLYDVAGTVMRYDGGTTWTSAGGIH